MPEVVLVVTPFQVCLIYNGHCCDLLFLLGGLIMANFILPLFFHFKIIHMQIKDQNTDFETRSLTLCVNESALEHKWYHNINT
jgi:hypothetical protein